MSRGFNVNPKQYYGVAAVRKLIPSRPSNPTLWRWVTHGVRHGDGRVRLKAIKIGGRRLVLGADLLAFVDALNADKPSVVTQTPAQAEREHARDLAKLEALGV